MLKIYPAIFQEGNQILVTFPDLEGKSAVGATLEEAMEKAQDVLGFHLAALLDEGKDFPQASELRTLQEKEAGLASYVSVDMEVYKEKYKNARKTEKEKFVKLLETRGISAEMGVTPVKPAYVLHTEGGSEACDYWFVECEGDIRGSITKFVRWNIDYYIFASVENEDYENGRYKVGVMKELADYNNPEGVHEAKENLELTFDELVEALQ